MVFSHSVSRTSHRHGDFPALVCGRVSPLIASLAAIVSASLTTPLHANEVDDSDTPFRVEDFAPTQGRHALTVGVGYRSSDRRSVSVSTNAIPIAHGYALVLPEVNVDDQRRDALFVNIGMRYAISSRSNLNIGLKADTSRSLIRENDTTRTERETDWRTLSAGFDHRITRPFDQPYVLAFAEVALAEQSGGTRLTGKTATLGGAGHWAFDPVILSLTGTYSYLASREIAGRHHDPGDVLGIGMSVGLAMNPEISVRGGVNQSFRLDGAVDDSHDHWQGSTALTLGYVQRFTPSVVMNFNVQGGVAGNDMAQITASLTWRR
ncbi:hypothetical protein LRB11_14070 [Ectothiorhodospira haloalkaliphila]|uniref:hypothetical protein n=1 Tax=Ectothiorhodospira haloalkaliphila TaxID=421628 RepID=UPI001EE8931C|nr:hypothetical protein [Ectothiorhodospira haloalkaliphila]MCG5526047.1 hypothetical protein [Ectothiorhodospira haloalkaliphila]